MVPTLGGGTQDTDFKKGFTKGILTKKYSAKKWGGQGDPDPLMIKATDCDKSSRVSMLMFSMIRSNGNSR